MNSNSICVDKVRILLCDDQEIVAYALKEMFLDCQNWDFLHVSDPKFLLTQISQFEPTVILQDLVLPETSGIDVLKSLRSNPVTRDIPVILLSTTDDSRIKFDAFAAGASDYVVKFPEKFELVGRVAYHSRAFCNLKEREKANKRLEQKSRLESLGNLAAGIAHEINTPLQYITANLSYLRTSLINLTTINCQNDIENAISETIEGIEQISTIVRAMKAFAHPGKQEMVMSSLNSLIQDIATLSRNEWKDYADLKLDLDEGLPLILCSPGSIAQVLLNLVVNAAQAIRGNSNSDFGNIMISTRAKSNYLEVEVSDNGGGIPQSIQGRIFEPFFTTKDIGEGSGQGLSISRGIIQEIHRGELNFRCVEGVGTSFFIRLPFESEPIN